MIYFVGDFIWGYPKRKVDIKRNITRLLFMIAITDHIISQSLVHICLIRSIEQTSPLVIALSTLASYGV